MRASLVAAVAAVLAAAGCAGAPSAQVRHHRTSPAPVELTSFQACRRLRADVMRTRDVPDLHVLEDIADHVSDPRLAADARTAVRDIAHTGIAPVAFMLLRDDCARAGVQIPAF
jgi:hypothetical protein